MWIERGVPLPLEGRVAAKRPGGVAATGLGAFFCMVGIESRRAAAPTPSGRLAAISPSRGERTSAP